MEHIWACGRPLFSSCEALLRHARAWLRRWGFREGQRDAIAHVRRLRPGNIETAGQEAVVAKYAKRVRSRKT